MRMVHWRSLHVGDGPHGLEGWKKGAYRGAREGCVEGKDDVWMEGELSCVGSYLSGPSLLLGR